MRTKLTALAAASLLALIAAAGFSAPAQAAPGSPGTPSAPVVLWQEDFENASTVPSLLADYNGSDGTTFTSDAGWANPANCTGILTKFAVDTDPSCASSYTRAYARQYAYALGHLNGTPDPATNVALTEIPVANVVSNSVEFATAAPLQIPVTDRFIGFSLDAAWGPCYTSQGLKFFLKDGATELPASTSPIRPCYHTGRVTVPVPAVSPTGATMIYAGTYAANSAMLFSGSEFGVVLRNAAGNTSYSVSEHTIDNIRVLDSTPQLDKSFSLPGPLKVGDPVKLTFTVTNTTELVAKEGWSFTDTLPAGLIVAAIPKLTSTCGPVNSVVSALTGTSTITVTDGVLAAGAASCNITVNVTANDPGTYANEAADFTVAGLNKPNGSAVVYALVAGVPMGDMTAIGAGIAALLAATAGGVIYIRRRSASSAA